MSNFVGKWVDDKDTPVIGLEDFMNAIEGLSDEDKKMWMEAVNTLEYKKDGDTWVCLQSTTAMPGEVKEFRFKSGVPFEDKDIDGSSFKATVTVVSDSEMKESSENMVYGKFEITRKVDGNKMEMITKMKDKTLTTYMKRA